LTPGSQTRSDPSCPRGWWWVHTGCIGGHYNQTGLRDTAYPRAQGLWVHFQALHSIEYMKIIVTVFIIKNLDILGSYSAEAIIEIITLCVSAVLGPYPVGTNIDSLLTSN
jgi:hypothetical protein